LAELALIVFETDITLFALFYSAAHSSAFVYTVMILSGPSVRPSLVTLMIVQFHLFVLQTFLQSSTLP